LVGVSHLPVRLEWFGSFQEKVDLLYDKRRVRKQKKREEMNNNNQQQQQQQPVD
jgi:uncharacterized protein YueI